MDSRDELAKIISTLAVEFITMSFSQLDEGIQRALQIIGEYAEVDRSYIFIFNEAGDKMDNTHEWCSEGITPQIESLQDLSTDQFPWFIAEIREGVVNVPRVSDLPEDAHSEKEEWMRENIRSLINIPLVQDEKTIGFLGFDAVNKEVIWEEDTITLLELVGEMIVNTLVRKQTHRDQMLRDDELAVLQLVLKLMNKANSVRELIKGALEIVGEIFEVDYFGIGLLKKEENLIQGWHMDRDGDMLHANLPIDRGIVSRVIRTGQSELIGDVSSEEEYIQLYGEAQSELCVPIALQEGVIGAINAENREINGFEERDQKLLEIFAGQFALAYEKVRLFETVQENAIRDPLTELYNRRHFFEAAEIEFAKARRYDIPLSAIMLDMKNFKRVNDMYGHAVGDEALLRVSKLMEQNLRQADIAARYGGDEFILLLPGSDHNAARKLATRLREKMETIQIKEYESLRLDINQGLAEMDETCEDLHHLLNRADQMLILAKKSEEKNIVMWGEGDIDAKIII